MLKEFDNDQINSLAFTGSLIKGLVHNINTPLASIMGRADILGLRFERVRQHITDPAALQEFDKCRQDISLIIDNCNRVSSLVKNARYRCSTAAQNAVQPVNIACVLRDDLEFLMSDTDFKHNIEKRFRIDTSVPEITGSHVRFSNSFIEFILNAQDAMRDNAEKILTVSAGCDGSSILVAISDNGRGMDEQTHRAVMQALEKPADPGACPASGLACAASLLQPYHPRFQVESRPGCTTLTIEFPLQPGVPSA